MALTGVETALARLTFHLSQEMVAELQVRAEADGLTPEEMAANLFVIAFRTADLGVPFPSFTVPDDCAAAFIKDGFRVLSRSGGCHTLGPYDGVPFQDAVASLQSAGLSEAEILEVVRS